MRSGIIKPKIRAYQTGSTNPVDVKRVADVAVDKKYYNYNWTPTDYDNFVKGQERVNFNTDNSVYYRPVTNGSNVVAYAPHTYNRGVATKWTNPATGVVEDTYGAWVSSGGNIPKAMFDQQKKELEAQGKTVYSWDDADKEKSKFMDSFVYGGHNDSLFGLSEVPKSLANDFSKSKYMTAPDAFLQKYRQSLQGNSDISSPPSSGT